MVKTYIKVFLKSFTLTLIILLSIFFLSYFSSYRYSKNVDNNKIKDIDKPVSIPKQPMVNVLTSIKDNDASIPRFFLIVSIKPADNTIYITSMPSSTAVYLNGAVSTLGQSYAYAGLMQSVKSIKSSYGIGVDAYIDCDFTQFGNILDTFGILNYNVFENINKKDEYGRTIFKINSGINDMTGNMIAKFLFYSSIDDNEKSILLSNMMKDFIKQNFKVKNNSDSIASFILTSIKNVNSSISSTVADTIAKSLFNIHENTSIKNIIIYGDVHDNIFYLNDSTINEISKLKNEVTQ